MTTEKQVTELFRDADTGLVVRIEIDPCEATVSLLFTPPTSHVAFTRDEALIMARVLASAALSLPKEKSREQGKDRPDRVDAPEPGS